MLARLREHEQQHASSDANATGSAPIHFYSSSGGNAGLAAATCASLISIPCTVVVPLTTPQLMIDKIKKAGAVSVPQVGASWKEADTYLRKELLSSDKGGVYVPPFDHVDIWQGASTIVSETRDQWKGREKPPAAIICSVGGGGLLAGVSLGLDTVASSWQRPGDSLEIPIIAVETKGADSLAQSLRVGSHVSLDAITSEASTLGAKEVCTRALEVGSRRHLSSVVLRDCDARRACVRLADDTKEEQWGRDEITGDDINGGPLVELSCGVAVALCFSQDEGNTEMEVVQKRAAGQEINPNQLDKDLGRRPTRLERALGRAIMPDEEVVIVLCGGSNVKEDMIEAWREESGLSRRSVIK